LKRAIVSVTNDLFTDQRVNRTCLLLYELGYEVVLVGRKKINSPVLKGRKYNTKRFKLLFEKGFLFYATYNITLFFYLLFKKVDLLVSNDLDTLLPNFLTHKIKGVPLVYDSHEYFLGVPEIQNRKLVKKTWAAVEKFCFPHIENIFTVNASIAALYKEKYGKLVKVMRNISSPPEIEKLRDRTSLGMPTDKKIVVLQGAGINIDRGGEEALLAMLPEYGLENTVLYIIGDGDAVPSLKRMAEDNHLKEKVFFLPKQNYEDLFHYTANADLGLTLDKDTNMNYRYSLPNKVFDYIHAQIPILGSSLIEVKRVIENYDIGLITPSHEPKDIANCISAMLSDEKKYGIWKKNLKIASQKLTWDNEKKEIENVFKKYI